MKNNEALKKHHFWILFGLVPLFVLIAVIMISSSVGGKIEEKTKAIDDTKKDLASRSNPKSKGLLKLWDQIIETVDGKRGGLWQKNWDKQKDLYTWPKSEFFTNFVAVTKEDGKDIEKPVRLEDLSFGQTIPNNRDQYAEFKKPEFYLAEFSTQGIAKAEPGKRGMADMIEPTQFKGGWQSHLRHVTDWGEKRLTSDQIWLIMEDIWVQRSLLRAIKSVNDQMAAFERVKFEVGGKMIDDPESRKGPHDPLRRKFRSRNWEVSIEVAKKGNRQYLKGTLENITDRLQVLGIGKTMTLKVWLEGKRDIDGNLVIGPDGQPDVEGIEPIEFYIGSEFLPGRGSVRKIKDPKDPRGVKEIEIPANIVSVQPDEVTDKDFDRYPNLIPVGKTVSEIVRIEQKFDRETVPVKRIEAMQLGKTDSRYAAMGTLKAPLSPPFAKIESTAASGTTDSAMGPMPGPSLGGSSRGGPMRPPGLDGGSMGSGDGRFGGGAISTVIDGNLNRYVDVTQQVRRMPVGIVVVVDQSQIQDVLLAFANSPLRFQITQVTWARFRGDLGLSSPGDSSSGPGSQPFQQQGMIGQGFFGPGTGDPDERRGMGSMGMVMPRPGAGGSSMGGPTMPRPGGSALGPPPGPRAGGTRPPTGGGGLSGDESSIGGSPPAYPSGYGSGYGAFGMGGGSLTSISEAQLTSGLVELSIYGIVSLYEKYDPAKDDTAAKNGEAKTDETKSGDAKEVKEVKEGDGKALETKDGTKDAPKDDAKKDGVIPSATDPKKRVRRRPARRS